MSNDTSRRHNVASMTCQMKGCPKRPVMGFDVHFCATHLQEVSGALMQGRMLDRCFWPGCKEYGSTDRLRVCRKHTAIIVNAYADSEWVINKVAEMRELGQPKPKPRTLDGHVYLLLSDNLVKIGWTSDLDRRLKEYSPGARILAVMPGTKKDEGRLHRKFGDLKTNRREWFTYHPRVMEEVERIIREHGDPPRDLNEPMTTTRIVGPRLNRPTQRRARSLNN